MNFVTSWKILRWPKFEIISLKDGIGRCEKPPRINLSLNKSSYCPRCFQQKNSRSKCKILSLGSSLPLKQCLLYCSVYYHIRILYIKRRIWNYLDLIREYNELMELQLAAASNFKQQMECATLQGVSNSAVIGPPAKLHHCKNKIKIIVKDEE